MSDPTELEAAKNERDQPMRRAMEQAVRRAVAQEAGVTGYLVVVVLDNGEVDFTWEALGGVRQLTLVGALQAAQAKIVHEANHGGEG